MTVTAVGERIILFLPINPFTNHKIIPSVLKKPYSGFYLKKIY